VFADPTVFHKDQYAAVGESVTIQCHVSNSEPVLWDYVSSEKQKLHNVYDRQLINHYKQRFTIDHSTYDLTILHVELDDTGEYHCIEDDGFGITHVTKLFVTGILQLWFLRATASMLSAHMLSQFRPSVCPSVRLSVCHTGGSVKNG